jgi:hypothetical protein
MDPKERITSEEAINHPYFESIRENAAGGRKQPAAKGLVKTIKPREPIREQKRGFKPG